MIRKVFYFLIILSLTGLVVLIVHHVPTVVTDEDQHYIRLFLQDTEIENVAEMEYADQIEYIRAVQKDILDDVERVAGIGMSQPREPKNLYESRDGLCYDIGRSMEKALKLSGFKTRHVAAYSQQPGKFPFLATIRKSQIASHAIQEVKTKNGWLVVDSNLPWLAIDKNNKPYSMNEIARIASSSSTIEWYRVPYFGYEVYFDQPVIPIYGLLSRHGQFYPPYNRIPDYNLKDLLYNF